jgi:hypothetical protein
MSSYDSDKMGTIHPVIQTFGTPASKGQNFFGRGYHTKQKIRAQYNLSLTATSKMMWRLE